MGLFCKNIKTLIFLLFFPLSVSSDVIYPLRGLSFENKKNLQIISAAPSITEILYFLGLFENVVALTRYDDFPEEVKEKEVIGGYLDIDIEKVVRLKPDVVFCEPNSGIKGSVELLVEKKVPVYVVNANSILDILLSIEEMGKLMCREEEARRLLDKLYIRYIHLQKKIKATEKSSALLVLNENPIMVAGKNSFVGELLTLSGLKNAYMGEYKYPVLDNEALIVLKPDIIINISESVMMGGERPKENFYSVFKGFLKDTIRFYNTADPVFVRPSPRFIDALERLCSISTEYYCF